MIHYLDSFPVWVAASMIVAAAAFGLVMGAHESLSPLVPILQASDFSAGMLIAFGLGSLCLLLLSWRSKPVQGHLFSNPFLPFMMAIPISLLLPLDGGASPLVRVVLWAAKMSAGG